MNSHKNALLTPKGREAMVRAVVDDGRSVATVARLYRTTPKTVAKWVARFRAEGIDGLRDRSSRPLSSPSQTPPTTAAAIEALRRQRHTGKQIAGEVGVLPGHRQPRPAPAGPQLVEGAGAGGAGSPIRARPSRRDDSPRHQKTRPLRADRTSHHGRSQGSEQPTAAASAGSSSTSASTTPRASPSPRS